MFNIEIRNKNYQFHSINELMAKANEYRSGDGSIGLCASDEKERVAAQTILSDLTLEKIYENPSIPYESCEVTRAIYDELDDEAYRRNKNWSVGELREFFLKSDEKNIVSIQKGLTPEMVAAAVKISSNMDLVIVSQKLKVVTKAKTAIGLKGCLSSRLQPNHPTDSIAGILALTYEGLSYGCGDCLIGVNPAIDSVENVIRIAEATQGVIEKYHIPTVNCVLSHLSTQMAAERAGASLDILFQSIAGNEKTNRHFGVSVSMLKEACAQAFEHHRGQFPNVLYFETGQGSELSLDSHEGVDQVTLEARTYGLARLFSPYMVNNVSGFIGPEILFNGKEMVRANLEDHAMGKILGLPMGMAPCYTSHAEIDQNDHEIATMLLTLAGSNYFMAIAQNDDVMLSYQDTSFHDNVALRKMCGLKTTQEFEVWMEKMGLMLNGEPTEGFGNASFFA